MPYTLNGIGTHYYGKRNLETRPGVCEQCGREVQLASYDTRLWFVVVFIPIFPLGRKRVLDQCPKCRRHGVTDLAEWESLKERSLVQAMEQLRSTPRDPKAAMELHRTLVSFGRRAEAEKYASTLAETFADNAEVRVHLGSFYEYLGQPATALPHYQRAYELDPEQPVAKVAVGLSYARQGRLEEARALLAFLERPEAPRLPGPLFALAAAFQGAGRHAEANELFRGLVARFPELAQDKKFRALVRESEQAAGVERSALPRRRLNLRPVMGWGLAGALLLALAFGSNAYIARHRTLYVASGFERPVTIEIAGHGQVTLNRPGWRALKIPEGNHRAVIRGAVDQQVDFEMRSDFLDRWFKKPAYLLNAGGSALLLIDYTVYSDQPGQRTSESFELRYGQPFFALPNVDYHFREFPETIRVDTAEGRRGVAKSRIDLLQLPVETVFYALAEAERWSEALRLAEWHFELHPTELDLLPPYLEVARGTGLELQARDYLARAVKRRPLEIPWHRFYQEMRIAPDDLPGLVAEYDALLESEPQSSELLYLRGRLSPSVREAMDYYQRAVVLAATNAYAQYALGQSQASLGQWAQARGALGLAVSLEPENDQFQEAWFTARLALGEFEALESELNARRETNAFDFPATARLIDVLLARERTDAARRLAETYGETIEREYPEVGKAYALALRLKHAYAAADFAAITNLAEQLPAQTVLSTRFQAMVEMAQPAAAQALLDAAGDPADINPFHLLALSFAWHHAGNATQAEAARARGVQSLKQGRPDMVAAAVLLEQSEPVPLETAMDIGLAAHLKAAVLTALGQRFPAHAADYFRAAQRLNVDRSFPHHLIRRITGG